MHLLVIALYNTPGVETQPDVCFGSVMETRICVFTDQYAYVNEALPE